MLLQSTSMMSTCGSKSALVDSTHPLAALLGSLKYSNRESVGLVLVKEGSFFHGCPNIFSNMIYIVLVMYMKQMELDTKIFH